MTMNTIELIYSLMQRSKQESEDAQACDSKSKDYYYCKGRYEAFYHASKLLESAWNLDQSERVQ